MKNVSTCFWFNGDAEAAAKLYTSLFSGGEHNNATLYGQAGEEIPGRPGKDTVMTVPFSLCGRDFLALNGGPHYKLTPAISLFVDCETEQEISALFKGLSDGGTVMMPLMKYPFSDKFAWVSDRFGVSWQLNLARTPQKLTPFLMFHGNNFGRAEEAVRFYTSVIDNSSIVKIEHQQHTGISQTPAAQTESGHKGIVDVQPEPTQYVHKAIFTLNEQEFRAIDSPVAHEFQFTPATSFIVNCDTQQEIDRLWSALSEGGMPVQCGWLQDKFGVSWQIVPTALAEMMGKGDRARNDAMMSALLKMVKLDIAQLQQAYERG